MKYTFREPYILLKQYTSKQGFGNGHPEFRTCLALLLLRHLQAT